MAKVSIKSEKINAFSGIIFILDKFDSILSSVIDSYFGLSSTLVWLKPDRHVSYEGKIGTRKLSADFRLFHYLFVILQPL